jgi:hypothetical protein
MMQLSPEVKVLGARGRFALWESHHQPLARLLILTTGLVVFHAFLPAYLGIAFKEKHARKLP